MMGETEGVGWGGAWATWSISRRKQKESVISNQPSPQDNAVKDSW